MKASRWMRQASLAVLALMVALAGCESAVESGVLLEPSRDAEQLLGSVLEPVLDVSSEPLSDYTLVRETEASAGSVEAVIGVAGGRLVLGNHVLVVPPKAVEADTRFRIEKEYGDEIRLHLTASRHTENDVGQQGFSRPVRLSLSYANAADLELLPLSELLVMYIRPDQQVEPLLSVVNLLSRTVEAELEHFSEYGMGWPNYK